MLWPRFVLMVCVSELPHIRVAWRGSSGERCVRDVWLSNIFKIRLRLFFEDIALSVLLFHSSLSIPLKTTLGTYAFNFFFFIALKRVIFFAYSTKKHYLCIISATMCWRRNGGDILIAPCFLYMSCTLLVVFPFEIYRLLDRQSKVIYNPLLFAKLLSIPLLRGI